MDAGGVDAAVIHPPGWDPGSNELALEAVRQHPTRLVGLRFVFLQPHQKPWPTDGTMDWLWPAAERAGVPLALLAADFLPVVARVAERHPRLKLIIHHLGRPHRTKDEAAWANPPELLAPAKPCTVTLFTEELPWLTARDKELIMGRALCTWLDWKI
ncbi:MAG TPA: amidohydrolase family protein [Methylomirabilota bacterium]|nr:amidohydrolase family protein [Methylomirabilota bacterium]